MVEDVLNLFTKDTLSNFKKDDELYFLWKIQKGWENKNIPTTKEYIDRINYEVNVICKMGFVDYMLMIADILEFADKNGIPRGPGRGCFSPNNRVRVNADEFKNINNVIPFKDKVQCEDGEWRQVEKVWEYDCNEELLTIQTESGKMLDGITGDHKVKVVTKEDYEKGNLEPKWIESGKIKEGDFLVEQGALNAKLTKATNITKKYYQGKVYDLKVKDVHSYTVDDLTVHNSAAGSIVSYALNITTIDPIIYGLYFERFLNPSRISNPDVDIDLGTLRRHEAFEYLQKRYGEDRVASIMTKGLMKSRSIIRNVGGSLGMPTGPGSEIDKIAKLFPNMEGDFEESVAESEELQKYAVKYPELFDKAKRLAGKPKSVGVHAAGTLVAPCKIEELMPMGRGTNGKTSVVQWDMYDVEDAGLVKLDLLGLNTLDVIDRTIKLIEKRYGKKIDIESIPMDDKLAINVFRKGKTNGLFQLERKYVQKICERMDITKFEDICAINALIRPGALHSGATELYIKRKIGEEEYICPHESLRDALKDTYGVVLYQETAMRVARDYAGFTMAEADNLRKCVSGNNYFICKSGTYTVKEVFDRFKRGLSVSVLCPDKNGKHIYRNLSDIWSNGTKGVYRIKTASGFFIDVTNDHKILTNNGYKEAKDISIGDFLAVFKKYLTYSRAKFINNYIGDEMLEDVISRDYRFSKVDSIEYIGEEEVFDFTIDSDEHIAYINGIVVHNCIGKKIESKMKEIKKEFFDKAGELGRPKEVTEMIFSQIETAQKYSFNMSHAVSYGKITYQSAWLKSHYFLEFMTELLNGEENSGEPKLDSYLRECRTNGVDILPPDARVANNYFQIEGKKGIRFGLGFVKGVTSLATNALRECSEHMSTFTDILMNDKGYLKKNIMENLILVGAFDYMGGNRAEILNRYSVVKDMVEKYKSQQKRKGEGVNIRKEYTREDILEVEKNTKFFDKKYSMEEYIAFEHQLCKCYIVNDPLTPFEDLIYSDEYRDIMDIVDKRFDRTKPVKLIAVVRSMNVHTITKGNSEGREMCFFDVFDTFMEITCIAFPEVFEKIKEKMFENSVYTFIGKYDGESIILNDAELMLKV